MEGGGSHDSLRMRVQMFGEGQKFDGGGVHMGGFSDQAETSGFFKGTVTSSDQF